MKEIGPSLVFTFSRFLVFFRSINFIRQEGLEYKFTSIWSLPVWGYADDYNQTQ